MDFYTFTMTRYLHASFLLLLSSGLVISAQTLPRPQHAQRVSAVEYQAAVTKAEQAKFQELTGRSNSDFINAEQNDAQAIPNGSRPQYLNQATYKPSFGGHQPYSVQNSQQYYSSNSQQYQSSNNQQYYPSNNQQYYPASSNQQYSQQNDRSVSNAQQLQLQPQQATANRGESPLKPAAGASSGVQPVTTSFPCDDIKSVQCQESIDANITKGIAVLAQNLSVSIARANAGFQDDGNIVFSPVNVAAALALVLVGSDGETFRELSHVLGIAAGLNLRPEMRDVMYQEFGRFLTQLERRQTVITSPQNADGGNQVVFANGLFVQKDFCILDRFEKIAKHFRSEVYNIDFERHPQESKDKINTWFDTQTRGRIKNMLVQAPPSDTRVLIASALYFNGEWETPFPSDVSSVRLFFVSPKHINNTYVDAYPVNMMTNSLETRYYADRFLGCKMVELPYKGRNVSMFLILPDQPGVAALRDLESRLSPEYLLQMISTAKVLPTIISMPRMKLSQTISLRSALEALGVWTLFNPIRANLTLISEGRSTAPQGECPKVDVGAQSTPAPVSSTPAPSSTPTAGQTSPPKAPAGKLGASQDQVRRAPSAVPTPPPFDQRKMLLLSRRNDPAFNRLFAADILHKVDVEVTETGTVAASGTATTISRDGSNQVVRLNRPFLFLIRDNPSGLTLFYGSVVRPNPATAAEIEEAGPMATAVPPTRRPPFNSGGHVAAWG